MKIIIRNKKDQIIKHFTDSEDNVTYYCGHYYFYVKHSSPKYDPLYMYHIEDVKSVAVIP